MTRSSRMAPVQRVLGDTERKRAHDLGDARQKLGEAESKLQSLQQYQQDYLQSFKQRAAGGQSALALRDFQAFLARLEEAIKQQELMVARAREELAGSTRQWQKAAHQVKAVDSVVDRWRGDERRAANRREQKEADERAQRKPHARSQSEAG
jgi:flagellar FliJ protein